MTSKRRPHVGVAAETDAIAIARAVTLAEALRQTGHLTVRLDPLTDPPSSTHLEPEAFGVSEEQLAKLPAGIILGPVADRASNAFVAYQALKEIYAARIGYEFGHVTSIEKRSWLEQTIESELFAPKLDAVRANTVLDRLTSVEAFERFLHRAYVGQKRFSIEGVDALVPVLDEIVGLAAQADYGNVILAMAHRGRLAVRTHVAGQPFMAVFQAFAHNAKTAREPVSDPGDVKYHLGATGRHSLFPNGPIVHLRPNPSHLEWINPVAEGYTRALQDVRGDRGAPTSLPFAALPVVVHGDAAFPGEGIVAETLNLAGLAGYSTGGTLHIIANNQIGFTTEPSESRSTRYSSDLAKGFDIPILHVSADDVEACIAATRLAFAYREQFRQDVLIDIVGYRRWGHNEGDEPAYTQPVIYDRVHKHPTVRQIWADELEARGILRPGEADQRLAAADAQMRASNESLGAIVSGEPPVVPALRDDPVTGVPIEQLRALNASLLARPECFTPNPKLELQIQKNRGSLEPGKPIDWAHAESLAFATILAEGTAIRLTGQDTERGTFSHRHLVLHDPATGARFCPLEVLPQARASFAVHNSPLSEGAVLGFEYGYSAAAPETLVIWEAQYGDFANVAQVIMDQFIAAAWAKWQIRSGVVLLLPHGYEGQGPEHSSARIERYLQLFADDNFSVMVPSTADQYFHALRKQAVHLRAGEQLPLVLFTPKSLLRSSAASATLERLTEGAFAPVLDDPEASLRAGTVTRLVVCSGKLGIELLNSPLRRATPQVAIVRLEQIAPFPTGRLARVLAHYPNRQEVVWAQEEPRNMGAFGFVFPRLWTLLPPEIRLHYVGRLERSSPAEGSAESHNAEQARIVSAVFGHWVVGNVQPTNSVDSSLVRKLAGLENP